MTNPATSAAPGSEPAGWLEQRERGVLWLMRASFWLATVCGRTVMKGPVTLVALWYVLFDRKAVAASRDWLRRVRGREPRWSEVFAHIRNFAQVTLDRVLLITGRTRAIEFTCEGDEHLAAQVATGRGAILLGAHLGSYEALRAGGMNEDVPIQILGYFKNSRMVNELLGSYHAGQAARVIHLGEDPVGAMARVRGRLEDGEMVAVLGDRVGLNERVMRVPFFGEPAAFSPGPFMLAHVLRCPVYLVFGLYAAPGRYDLHCEPFAERVDLPRKGREQALYELTARYAERVEAYARRAPYNWFNFFDFWSPA